MPFYSFSPTTELGYVLRHGLNELRSARHRLAHVLGVLAQMSDAQIATQFGFETEQAAAAAKAELQSGIGLLLDNSTNTTAQQYAAVIQMLNQFG